MNSLLAIALSLAFGVWSLGGAVAQSIAYPSKPIKIIVPFDPGGGADMVATAFVDELSQKLGKPVVKANHPGSNSIIGTTLLAKSPPDGHTLLATTAGIAINPYLYLSMPYKTPEDFAPVSILTAYPFVLGARRNLPVNSVAELIAYAKANPGKLTAANTGRGASAHLALGLLNNLAGTNIRPIPFKGAGPGLTAVAGGFVDMIFSGLETVRPFVETGKMKYLAHTGPEAMKSPAIPAIAETVSGYQHLNWMALFAPAGTPPEVVEKLNTALKDVFADPKVKKKLENLNIDIIASSPAEAKDYLVSQMALTKNLVESLGIKPE
jgi:tripartite-type tricarboxylate transporter receptor subunit TctC